MVNLSVDLQVWKNNEKIVKAVQGEGGSRALMVTFLDSDGSPADLTGSTARMYVRRDAGGSLFVDGTVVDAANGAVRFLIASGMTAEAGIFPCEFLILFPDGSPLKAEGLLLRVEASDLEPSEESTGDFSALAAALGKADNIVPQSRTVNGHALSGDIVLSAEDVGAKSASWAPTAADVGARPSTWIPTAEDVAAVPLTRKIAGLSLSADIALSQLIAGGLAAGDSSGNALNALKLGGINAANFPQIESGSWTPTLFGSTTAGNPLYSRQDGFYYKIGKLVFVPLLRITITSKGGMSGNVCIGGLPYTPTSGMFNIASYAGMSLNPGYVLSGVVSDGTAMEIQKGSGNSLIVQDGNLTDSFVIYDAGMIYLTI